MTVTDTDGFEHSARVFVDINNVLLPPAADGGPQHVFAPGITVTLNGSNSYDSDGTNSSVLWEQVSGNTLVDLATPTDLTTDLTAPAVDTGGAVLMFKLIVKDNDNLVSEDTVNVTVTSATVSAASSDRGASGGSCFIQSVMN